MCQMAGDSILNREGHCMRPLPWQSTGHSSETTPGNHLRLRSQDHHTAPNKISSAACCNSCIFSLAYVLCGISHRHDGLRVLPCAPRKSAYSIRRSAPKVLDAKPKILSQKGFV